MWGNRAGMRKQRRASRRKRSRGSIFIISLLTLTTLLVFGILSIQLGMFSILTATRNRNLVQTVDLAEAAVDMAEAYLRAQASPPVADFSYPTDRSWISLTTGKCRAWVDYVGLDPLNGLKIYAIYGFGNANISGSSRTINEFGFGNVTITGAHRTVVEQLRQQSFGLYSYFSDQEVSSITNGTIWFYYGDQLWGPVHTNDQFHIIWNKTDTTPIFNDTVSSTNSSVDYGSNGQPTNTTDWKRIFSGGQSALTLHTDRIPLPTSTDQQKNAAWGATAGFPTSNGINLPLNGSTVKAGIYIRGDSTVAYSVESGTGNQIITIVQGSTTEVITVDLVHNSTKVKIGTNSPTTYTGVPNGMLYSTGNITSLSGTLADNYENGASVVSRNSWTIATDVNSSKDITITGNLKYNTQPDSTKSATDVSNLNAATLGLVAHNVTISTSCPNDMTINGVVLAGGENTSDGSFYFTGYNGGLRGNLHLLGGVIQKKRGPVGQLGNNDQISNGYTKDYRYDKRMVDYPPPFFPTTGQYDVLSWQAKVGD